MSLTFFNGGRLLRFADVVDLLDDEEDQGLALTSVLGSLWRDGLITLADRFRYSRETACGHVYQRLEVWANKYGRRHNNYSDGWFLLMVLKTSTENTLSDKNGGVKLDVGVQGTPPVLSGFEGLVPERGASRPPSPQCDKCDGTLPCVERCKRELN
jgi:hypothetical protein